MAPTASQIRISSPDSLQPHLILVSWCNLSVSFESGWAIFHSNVSVALCFFFVHLLSCYRKNTKAWMPHNILNAQPYFAAIIILHQTHSYSNSTATSAVCTKGALLLIKAAPSLFAPLYLWILSFTLGIAGDLSAIWSKVAED